MNDSNVRFRYGASSCVLKSKVVSADTRKVLQVFPVGCHIFDTAHLLPPSDQYTEWPCVLEHQTFSNRTTINAPVLIKHLSPSENWIPPHKWVPLLKWTPCFRFANTCNVCTGMTAIAWWYFLSGHQWCEAWWCRPYALVYRTGNTSQGYIWASCCPDVFWDSPVSTKAFSLSHACILHAKSFTTLWEAANCNILISQLVYKCTENCKACSTLLHICNVPSITSYIICSKNTIVWTSVVVLIKWEMIVYSEMERHRKEAAMTYFKTIIPAFA
jgi:hypothetical protein